MGCCVIFCAAEFDAPARPLEKDDYILAADGGLKHTRKLGIEPNEIIGDFDSLGFTPPGADVFPVEKDDTDAMLAVKLGLARGYTDFLLLGATGGRLDHQLANFAAAAYIALHGGQCEILDRENALFTLRNASRTFDGMAGRTISVFSYLDVARGVTLRGMRYPLADAEISSAFPIGTSNVIAEDHACVSVRDGLLFVVLPAPEVIARWI